MADGYYASASKADAHNGSQKGYLLILVELDHHQTTTITSNMTPDGNHTMSNDNDTFPPVARLNDTGNEPEHQEETTNAAEPRLREPSAAYLVRSPTSSEGQILFLK